MQTQIAQTNNVIRVDFEKLRDRAKAERFGPTLLAQATGLTRATIYTLFNGVTEPSALTLKKVCDVIGLPIEEAFIEEEKVAV